MADVPDSRDEGAERSAPVVRRDIEADERDDKADDRESALDTREARIDARAAYLEAGERRAREILSGALERDERADERDHVANKRDQADSLDWFLHGNYSADDQKADRSRMAAAHDRHHSKEDRGSSADDRTELAGRDAPAAPTVDKGDAG